MNILDNLNEQYEIVSAKPASSEEEIQKLIKFSDIAVPEEYLNIIRQQADIKMIVKNREYERSIDIHGARRCIAMNQSLLMQKCAPGSLAIAHNYGDMSLIYATGLEGFGVYVYDWAKIDIKDAVYLSSSLENLLVHGEGIDILCEEFLAE